MILIGKWNKIYIKFKVHQHSALPLPSIHNLDQPQAAIFQLFQQLQQFQQWLAIRALRAILQVFHRLSRPFHQLLPHHHLVSLIQVIQAVIRADIQEVTQAQATSPEHHLHCPAHQVFQVHKYMIRCILQFIHIFYTNFELNTIYLSISPKARAMEAAEALEDLEIKADKVVLVNPDSADKILAQLVAAHNVITNREIIIHWKVTVWFTLFSLYSSRSRRQWRWWWLIQWWRLLCYSWPTRCWLSNLYRNSKNLIWL